jgi:hypothetical protein
MTVDDRRAREASVSSLLGWVVATGREAYQQANRRRMRSLWLTASERDTCLDELAEQYAVGRLDKSELDRRMDLLDRAVTHGDLGPVFAGLPWPTFRTARAVRPRRWRRLVFALAVWLALPVLFLGLVLAVAGHAAAGVIFGLPALVWVALWRRWASRG